MLKIIGVIREYEFDQKKPHDQWIRDIHFFDEQKQQFCIVSCTDKQAHALMKVRILEMDLSFKMVNGKTNIFSLVSWDDKKKRKPALFYHRFTNKPRDPYLRVRFYECRDTRCIPYNVP